MLPILAIIALDLAVCLLMARYIRRQRQASRVRRALANVVRREVA